MEDWTLGDEEYAPELIGLIGKAEIQAGSLLVVKTQSTE
jgi:hypothetical protein